MNHAAQVFPRLLNYLNCLKILHFLRKELRYVYYIVTQ